VYGNCGECNGDSVRKLKKIRKLMSRVIANTIEGLDIAQAAHDTVAQRWDNWDLTPYLVYLVDTCDASLLPWLAEQFDVDGLRGLSFAQNDDEIRELIKNSIAVHKRIGTPWALREACRLIGFPVIVLEEGVDTGDPDTDWARFRCHVEASESRNITKEMFNKLRLFVEMYKPERCHIESLGFHVSFEDKLFRELIADTDKIYDGTYEYDGTINYGAKYREIFELEVIGQNYHDYFVCVDSLINFVLDSEFNAIEIVV